MRSSGGADVTDEHTSGQDPFLVRLEWILEHAAERSGAPAHDQRTLRLVRGWAGLNSARALQKWQAGDYPKTGARRNQSVEQLDERCREELQGYPPPEGSGASLSEVAQAAWALRDGESTGSTNAPEPRGDDARGMWRWSTLVSVVVAVGVAVLVAVLVVRGTDHPERASDETSVDLVFNSLGAGSPIVKVYVGPEDSDADRTVVGRYPDGEHVRALCQARGRPVASSPELGEEERHSDQWIKIEMASDETAFATAVYADLDPLDAELPDC